MILYTKDKKEIAQMEIWLSLHVMVRQLRPDGMSSEEEGVDDNNHRVRIVLRCVWRAAMEPQLDVIDKVRESHSFLFHTQGAKPLPRVRP